MRSGALEMMLWYVLMAVWIFGTIAAIVHLVVKVHAPTWAVVLIAAAMIVVPVIPVVAYWAVRRRPAQDAPEGRAAGATSARSLAHPRSPMPWRVLVDPPAARMWI